MNYWLMKSEPDVFSYADLVKKGKAEWDGVRNHAAQLHMKAMRKGDLAFFYHSNIGVEAVGTVGAENRGAALGAYSVFLDISLGIAGPLDGAIAGRLGYAATFLFSAGCCIAAFGLTLWLLVRRRAATARV